jgi:nucleotide-binding universal stress UspA family protein
VGEPAEKIVQYARENGCEQIFMGTHGRGAVSKVLLGSVASKVVALSDVPVVLVK